MNPFLIPFLCVFCVLCAMLLLRRRLMRNTSRISMDAFHYSRPIDPRLAAFTIRNLFLS